MNNNPKQKFHIGQRVEIIDNLVSQNFPGTIINISNYRPPTEEFAIYVDGYDDDFVFVGRDRIRPLDYLE